MPTITLGLKTAAAGETADVEPKADAEGRTKGKVTTVKPGESVTFTVTKGLVPISISFKEGSPFGDGNDVAYGVPLTIPASAILRRYRYDCEVLDVATNTKHSTGGGEMEVGLGH